MDLPAALNEGKSTDAKVRLRINFEVDLAVEK